MELPDFLTMAPYNDIRLTGSRIGLYHVISYHREEGYDAEKLHEEFPTLSVELLNKVLEFYRQNREEVDAYVRQYQDDVDRQSVAGRHLDFEELRRRFEAMKREGKLRSVPRR